MGTVEIGEIVFLRIRCDFSGGGRGICRCGFWRCRRALGGVFFFGFCVRHGIKYDVEETRVNELLQGVQGRVTGVVSSF